MKTVVQTPWRSRITAKEILAPGHEKRLCSWVKPREVMSVFRGTAAWPRTMLLPTTSRNRSRRAMHQQLQDESEAHSTWIRGKGKPHQYRNAIWSFYMPSHNCLFPR